VKTILERNGAKDNEHVRPGLEKTEYDGLLEALGQDRLKAEQEASMTGEFQLDEAFRQGVEQGRRREAGRRRRRIGWRMAVAAASMLVLLTGFARISPAFAALLKEIPGMSGFVELISSDPSLTSALDNEYIQPVNRSDERNGYRLTVSGIIADSQRMVVLYSTEGGAEHSKQSFADFKLTDGEGNDIEAMITTSHVFPDSNQPPSNGPVQDYIDVQLGPGVEMPQTVNFRLKMGPEWLGVTFDVDHSRFAELEETISIQKEIAVGGQRVTVTEATITPLQVSVAFESDPANDKRLIDFIDLELVDEQGRTYSTPAGIGDLDNKLTRHFHSSYFHKPKELTLRAKGVFLSDRGLKLVINTDTGELLEAPDGRLKLIGAAKSPGSVKLELELHQDDEPGTKKGYTLLKHRGTFRDASGAEFELLDSDGIAMSWRSGSETATYYYRIPNEAYVQPLTFDIDQYLGRAWQDIAVRIK